MKRFEYSVGELVWLTSACKDGLHHGPPAVVLAAYIDKPKIFLYNEEANLRFLEEEDIGVGWVYDILHNGIIEYAVLGEWLEPLGDWLEPFRHPIDKEGGDFSPPSDD